MIFQSITGAFQSFEQLQSTLKNMPRKHPTLLVGIDGCGGSGKSTFTEELTKLNSEITIIHMDDFYLPSKQRINDTVLQKTVGADFDWKRLRNQVLIPLSTNNHTKYQVYDWATDTLGHWIEVNPGGIVVIEGVYSLRSELADFYDYKIFIYCQRETRLKRGLERDGENARDIWENNWMVAEDKYIREHRPFEEADLIIDGGGTT
ncbi:uridine kinase family protein [Oceanirhabdus sp. W0125-5]|uniref:uridine kinase family protein n=1 Tax=Oceanirhabdus sp. W0125-5 TaxID=2999116 RepID=UPI0022F2F341|nr:AAA family ATPase [Oceanirhabdus sp. W0125-5]WBW95826.1 AAA family ATPase [Oceanirhabdus sp. W0125-5]